MEKPSEDKFAIHAACREGKSKTTQSRALSPFIRQQNLTNLGVAMIVESLLNVRILHVSQW